MQRPEAMYTGPATDNAYKNYVHCTLWAAGKDLQTIEEETTTYSGLFALEPIKLYTTGRGCEVLNASRNEQFVVGLSLT